jgi:hypothetical protein
MPQHPEIVYPPTIDGSAEDKATGTSITIVARRTGMQDEAGCETYVVEVPMPGEWLRVGRVVLHFDLMPGRSAFLLSFTGEQA